MDDIDQKTIENEICKIIQERQVIINENYPKIRQIYQSDYGWPELDTLRDEICLCLMFGLNQAAITLSNHFVESLLKFSLICNESLNNSSSNIPKPGESPLKSHTASFETPINKYSEMNLNKSIECAFKENLISEKQKIYLHKFRENIRNAFSHSDKAKTFGESSVPIQVVQLDTDNIKVYPKEILTIKDSPIVQGLAQAFFAQKYATVIFIDIDKIAREIYAKIFGENKDIQS